MKNVRDFAVSAVIVAAGKATRMNMEKNKQYIDIGGQSVLARTILAFQESDIVDEIILVTNPHDIMFCKENIVEQYGMNKVKKIVAGGDSRQKSVYNGLAEVSSKCGIVLIHDGARPFIKETNIRESVLAAYEFGACCVAVPVKDTIKKVNNDGFVEATLDRSSLWSIQTPQTFKYSLIVDAHKKALEDNFEGTDDAVLVERLGHPLKLIMGSYDNIKITTREDLAIAEAIINYNLDD